MGMATFTIYMSGKAHAFFRGTGLAQGKPDNDPGSLSLADAYRRRTVAKHGAGSRVRLEIHGIEGVEVLAEYMDSGYHANIEADRAEGRACARVRDECLAAIAKQKA